MNAVRSLHDLRILSMKWLKLQRRITKWPVPSGVAIAVAMATAGCAPRVESTAPPVAGWNGDESPAYRSGHAAGSRDKREGRPPAPAPATATESYARGYATGYKNPNDNPWSRPRAHELGAARGRADKQSGRTEDPERHSAEVPRDVRDDFRRGYRAGWN